MANPIALTSRLPNRLNKQIVFTGASGLGLVSVAVPVFTVTGLVWIARLAIQCLTTFVSAGGGTLALGTIGATTGIIGTTTATGLTNTASTPLMWQSTTPATGCTTTVLTNIMINLNCIITVGTATVTAGVLEFTAEWFPMSAGAKLSL